AAAVAHDPAALADALVPLVLAAGGEDRILAVRHESGQFGRKLFVLDRVGRRLRPEEKQQRRQPQRKKKSRCHGGIIAGRARWASESKSIRPRLSRNVANLDRPTAEQKKRLIHLRRPKLVRRIFHRKIFHVLSSCQIARYGNNALQEIRLTVFCSG